MIDLIKSFDAYNEFERTSYFTICFNALPSELFAEVAIEGNKENIEKVLEIIDLKSMEFKVIFKSWITEDDKDSDLTEDYANIYLLKSECKNLVVWVSLANNYLNVDFLYDVAQPETEEWVIATNHKLRTSLGENKAPTFNILSKTKESFRTKEVKLERFEFNGAQTYNDDFLDVNEVIVSSLDQNKAGLILLHGKPGTGKTTYIKNLIGSHPKKTFIFIQNEFVKELLDPEFISFLLKHRDSVLIIEDAEKVITSREHSNENSVVSTILQLTDGLFSDYLNIKIICTFNTSMDKIDKALLRKGRMIAYYDFQPLSVDKTNVLMGTLGLEQLNKELTLAEIFNYKAKEFNQLSRKNKIGFQS